MSIQRFTEEKPLSRAHGEYNLPPAQFIRKYPAGAEVVPGGGVHFRVWVPHSKSVSLRLVNATDDWGKAGRFELEPEGNGYHQALVPQATSGMLYKYELGNGLFPDPASRFQPDGPHGPSQIIDPGTFVWSDRDWRGVTRQGQVVYEMHIGTFTPEGTWESATKRLPFLKELGITLLELMPVADWPGQFGWGYDGVDLYAPTRLYGEPDDMRHFIDQAHKLGLGVILDVVYNHIGPDGNYLKEFASDYFTDRYKNEWGEALNFDGENAGPVREFFSSNAAYWIDEYHLDGLRFDATQQIFDSSPNHILAVMTRMAREAAGERSIFLVAENESQNSRLVRPYERGGYGFDALWNDDFHHVARTALTGRKEAYYEDYGGTAQEFISAVKHGYLYQGQWYRWQRKRRGTASLDLAPDQFVTYLENHDQVANSLRGEHLHRLSHPGTLRALTALLLLGPGTPMLFQGQEFGASNRFNFFADHNSELAQLVAKGRREYIRQFKSAAGAECDPYVLHPGAPGTFEASKLNWEECSNRKDYLALHRDLLKLRLEEPAFNRPRRGCVDGSVLGPQAWVLRFFAEQPRDERLLLINLGVDLELAIVPEPLLAAPEGHSWRVQWSSEAPEYGGGGTPLWVDDSWFLPGRAALLLAPAPAPAPV
jgi:maltooligosyltrehalose trehalohydrolase